MLKVGGALTEERWKVAMCTTCYRKECMCLCRRVKKQMKRRGGGGKTRSGRDLLSKAAAWPRV